MARAKRLTAGQRGKLRMKAVMSTLPEQVRNMIQPRAPVTPADLTGLLRAWRRLGKAVGALPTRQRLAVRERFADTFARIFRSMTLKPSDFGVRGHRELADVFVTMLERIGYGQIPAKELRRRRGLIAGEALELLVQNLETLQKDFKRMARWQRDLLNKVLPTLVNAHGAAPAVPLKGKFGEVRKATDIVVVDRSGKPKRLPDRKFLDLAYVSFFEHASGSGPTMLSALVEVEIRMPAKAAKAGKQIGRAQVRFDLAPDDKIRMTVEGFAEPVEVSAEQILFAPQSINRLLVTVSDTPQYRPSFTARGGYPEHFWRIGVVLRADEIWRLIRAITP
jgi:hypothetical protein